MARHQRFATGWTDRGRRQRRWASRRGRQRQDRQGSRRAGVAPVPSPHSTCVSRGRRRRLDLVRARRPAFYRQPVSLRTTLSGYSSSLIRVSTQYLHAVFTTQVSASPCVSSTMLSTTRTSLPRTFGTRLSLCRTHIAAPSTSSLLRSPPPRPSQRISHKSPIYPIIAHNMSSHAESAVRPEPDQVLQDIADYVHNFRIESDLALETARLCLIDTIGCGLEALRFDACARLLGPVVDGSIVPNGVSEPSSCRSIIWSHLQSVTCRDPRSWYQLPARPNPRCFQYWYSDPLARFQ